MSNLDKVNGVKKPARRPRNEISRHREMALAAADLYDAGQTDKEVALALGISTTNMIRSGFYPDVR